jgi:hypothetical protein
VGARGDDVRSALFARLSGSAELLRDAPAVSAEAMRLHVYAILASIERGRPGFVPDSYLNSLSVETSVPALELCTIGVWQRADDDAIDGSGYVVLESETYRVASEVHRQLEELSARCRADGGHQPDPEHPGLCRNCAVRLG